MVEYVAGGNTYHINNTLGVTRDIKKVFNKEYLDIVRNMDKMKTDDLIKFVYTCLVDTGYDNFEDFKNYIYDESNLGMMDLWEFVGEINNQIQYPGKTKDEIKKITMERVKEQRELENI